MALNERLRRDLEQAGRPADPSGVYENLIRRHERRRRAKRLKMIALTAAVIATTVGGVVALSNVLAPAGDDELIPVAPGPSANGALVYTDGAQIVITAPDGSVVRSVPAAASGTAWHVAWAPGGDRLAVVVFGESDRSLWVMDPDGSNAVRLATAEDVGNPSWHPDGEHLTYAAEVGDRTEVHIVRVDGEDDRVVYADDAPGTFAVFSSSFSPDGSEILFDAGTDSGFDIFVMNADGSKVRRLTQTGSDYNPSWSPDGSRIVFTRQEDASESDIFVMDADGSDVIRLTDGGPAFTNLDAQFSPDGELITYEAARNGGTGPVMVMAADGTKARILVESQVLGFSWQPLPTDVTDELTPSATPTESAGQDIGLGYPVCNVTSIEGTFAEPSVNSTVFVATRLGGAGGCPQADDAFNVIAVDADGDGTADASFGPVACVIECRAFSAPDIDGDGTAELLVVQSGGSVVGLWLYDFIPSDVPPSIAPVTVAKPGDPDGGFEPGDEPVLYLGGDGFGLNALTCGEIPAPEGPGLIATSAESLPHDSPEAKWHAHQTTFVLRDGHLHVVDVREFTEAVTDNPAGPSFQSGETLCGSNLGP